MKKQALATLKAIGKYLLALLPKILHDIVNLIWKKSDK